MKYLKFSTDSRGVCELVLNRPEIHNAFDEVLIGELTQFFEEANKNDEIQLVILSGEGRSFCAGADLNWMKKMVNYTQEENCNDSKDLAGMLETMNRFSKPLIGHIDGAVMGGGVGLSSVCDFVVATERSFFALSEVNLGILPAVISPYVINKIGESQARRYFLSGERFYANRAQEIGLVHEVAADENASREMVSNYVDELLKSGYRARIMAKELVHQICHEGKNNQEKMNYTCELISSVRTSEEGQEGMSSLLEKRKPNWIK